MKNYILFDLDGTLVNTREGIVKSVYFALDALGIEESEADKLERFIGPPLEESFRDLYKLNETGVKRAIEKYRERYRKKGQYECAIYPGVESMLKKLKEAGCTLCVATSKPEVFMEEILKRQGIRSYFSVLVGATLDGSRVHKADIISEVIRLLPDVSVDEMIMVGDREHDIIGAKENGMKSVGIRHGFALPGEFERAGADYIVADADELADLFMKI